MDQDLRCPVISAAILMASPLAYLKREKEKPLFFPIFYVHSAIPNLAKIDLANGIAFQGGWEMGKSWKVQWVEARDNGDRSVLPLAPYDEIDFIIQKSMDFITARHDFLSP